MPKYLTIGRYTAEGAKGLIKEGGSARRKVVEQAIKSVGGTLEGVYFAFGDDDVYVLSSAPDNVSVAAVSLAAGASGTVHTRTVALLTPEEMDQAAKKAVAYRGAGQKK